MKQMIHCCFTSHEEVLFRSPDDVGAFLNILALCSWKYGVDIFADTEMSNHVHLLLFSSDKKENKLSYGMAGKTVHKNKYGHWIKTTSIQPKSIHGLVFPYGYSPITNRCDMKNYLPRYSEWPDGWVMSPSGV